jgi:PAS domain S-box-containing protein
MAIKKDETKRKDKLVSNKTRLSTKDKRSKVRGTDIDINTDAEEALKLSEQNFRNSMDSSIMAIRIVDVEWHTLYVNRMFLDMFGYKSIDEVQRTSLQDHYTPEEKSRYLERMERKQRGESIPDNPKVDIIGKDGAVLSIVTYSSEVLWDGKKQRQLIYQDITAQQKAADALGLSEQNFRNSLDSLPMGINIVNADGHILYANQGLLDIFGYENIEELRASPLLEHYTPESYANWLLRNEQQLRGEPLSDKIDIDIVRKDGTTRHLQAFRREMFWNGKQQYQTIYNDITERVQAEEALKISEQNFRNSMDNSSMGIRIVDADGHNSYLNQTFLNIFGYKNSEEVEANPPQEYYTPKSHADYVLRGGKLLSGESVSENYEVDIKRKDNTIRRLQLSRREVFWDGKQQNQILYNDITERVQTEDALRLSEQNFRNSMDTSSMGIRIMGDADYTVYANQALLDMFGYENIEELRASPPQEHYTPESRDAFVQRHEQFLRGEPLQERLEFDIIRKDGAIRHLQLSSKNVFWNGKQQFQIFYNDITERQKAEEALKLSEQNFRNSMDSSSIGIRIGGQTEETLYANQALLDIFGYKSRDEIQITPPHKYYSPDSYANYLVRHEKFLRGEPMPKQVEINIIRKDGTMRNLQVSMMDVFWNSEKRNQTLYNDITERKQAEEKVKRAALEWRTTFDSITDMICISEKNNRIVRVNKAYADFLKTTPQELIGKFCHELMHGTKEPPANCPHLQTLKTGKSVAMETFNPNFEIYFHESCSPIFNEKGEVTGSVIVAKDVTQQKHIEEQLIVRDRLASIGELSSGIAHELNNPLTSVIGFSQLLMQGDVPDNIKEDLGIIYSEAQRAAVIVKNLLTFARKHAPVKQLGQVNTVIEEVLKLRAYEQKVNNIEVEKHLAANLPEIMMDPFQIQQVFLNIIVNAEFAMLDAHQRGKLVITTERDAGVISIIFTDDGSGISEANLKSIFDPFFTTKEVGKGTGLGLSICHGIVTEHGGKIYAKSTKGQGATFVVELPLNEQ